MKKKLLSLLILLLTTTSFLYAEVTQGYAIGIFNEQGDGENIQHKRKTNKDYSGLCYSRIVVLGHFNQITPSVSIGTSKGHLIERKSLYNKRKIKIGSILTYKHYSITHGYFKVTYRNKTLDFKVYIK